MNIGDLQTNWDQLGRTDPFWAILSDPEKIHGQWDPQHFFSTGLEEVNGVLSYLNSLGINPVFGKALDFGCGVGRLTQAMSRYFKHCCGIDIAPSMIELANRYNRFGEQCEYRLNSSDTLAEFETGAWHFIYSNLVLQHMKPEYSKQYVREFLRVLAPDGVLVFQLPAEPNVPVPSKPTGPKLSDSGFAAAITPQIPMLIATPASQVEVDLKVKNISSQTWPSSAGSDCRVALGNHWLSEAGELLVLDDGRTPLPVNLEPGEELDLRLLVHTPYEPGSYILEFDMVQEFVAWFANKGSIAPRINARISSDIPESALSLRRVEQDRSQPVIEMYGVPKQEVLEIIANSGGRVVDVQEDLNAGAEWTSFRYCVMKGRP